MPSGHDDAHRPGRDDALGRHPHHARAHAGRGLCIADDPELAEQNAAALDLMAAYNATTVRQGPLRRRLLEELLGSVGEGTEIRPPFYVDYGAHHTVGARCFANFGLVALDVGPITIGDDVQLGPNVQLLTPTHTVEPEPRRPTWEAAQPITIGDTVWLGGGGVVCPGVTIAEATVVGAAAVVTQCLRALDVSPRCAGPPGPGCRRNDAGRPVPSLGILRRSWVAGCVNRQGRDAAAGHVGGCAASAHHGGSRSPRAGLPAATTREA